MKSRGIKTFFGQLRKDARGNTLAIMAIALIPISALAGSAVDMARLYVAKVRLQQACDAGVLAGRKFMTSSGSSTLDSTASVQAQTFFANNFSSGWLGTSSVQFTPTKTADNQVAGTASVVVPMTVMKMFKVSDTTLNVTCEARFDLADADIMFVLDTTGSMGCVPSAAATCGGASYQYKRTDGTWSWAAQEASGSKMSALREAVTDFDSVMRDNADPSTHIRYGFVTYSSSVNVGRLLLAQANNLLRTTARYNTRRLIGEGNTGSAQTVTLSGVTQSQCTNAAQSGRSPESGWDSEGRAYYLSNVYWESSRCRAVRQYVLPRWRYQFWPLDVSQYVTGGALNPTLITSETNRWEGCVEVGDAMSTPSASFDIDNLPPDLDPDFIPSSDETRWKPMWPAVTYRRNNASWDYSTSTWYEDTTTNRERYFDSDYESSGFAACGIPARGLAEMTAQQVSDYVNGNDFRPFGGTYHDIGMIWGTRMLSPNGIFAADTAAWPGRNAPARHIVFMTDGTMSPNYDIYSHYGLERYDQRVTGGSSSTMADRHNARFQAVCSYAKDRLNMTVWVVALGVALNDDLSDCASPGNHAFTASSEEQLRTAFKTIATQVAMLRVSK